MSYTPRGGGSRGRSGAGQSYRGRSTRNPVGRPKHHEDRTAQLPRSLLDQLDGGAESSRAGGRGGNERLSRKDERKQARTSTKGPSVARPRPSQDAGSGSFAKPSLSLSSSAAEESKKRKRSDEAAPALKVSSSTSAAASKGKLATSTPLSRLAGEEPKKKKKTLPTSAEVLGKAGSGGGGGGGMAGEEAEDGEIAWLEYALGRGKWSKTKGKAKQAAKPDEDDEMSDGLDDLLGDLDRLDQDLFGGLGGSDDEGDYSDDDDAPDEEGVRNLEDEPWNGISGGDDVEDGMDMEDESEDGEDATLDDDHDDHDDDDDDDDDDDGRSPSASPPPQLVPTADSAPSSLAAPAPGKYVPPALRARLAAEAAAAAGGSSEADLRKKEEMLKLEKTVNGLLNRLGESNIDAILGELEAVYRKYPRNDVTTALTNLILTTISSHANLLGSFVVLYAALVAGLYKLTGIEFGASFIQSLTLRLIEHLDAPLPAADAEGADDGSPAGKEFLNLLALIAELYNFQVTSSVLIFDLVRRFLEGDGLKDERSVEGLLRIVRNAGPQLRQDDPSSLKEIIMKVQDKAAALDATSTNSRTKFMLETLTNLKNNRIKAAQGGEATAEATIRMKKFLSGLEKKRSVLAHEPLRVPLADLLSADSKGKWWLVGAAWAGNPLVDSNLAAQQTKTAGGGLTKKVLDPEDDLMTLARKQGMNTDIRRKVFMAVMGSSDFADAHARLMELGLTDVQQREMVRVLLHCSANEKLYNPYYTLVLARLLQLHSHRFTLQYSLWDFFRELGEGDVGGTEVVRAFKESGSKSSKASNVSKRHVRNWAKAYGWCIAKEGTTLAVLKPINFTRLRPASTSFLQQLLISLVFASQTASPLLVLSSTRVQDLDPTPLKEAVMKVANLPGLCEGLLYFLQTSMTDDGPWLDSLGEGEKQVAVWGREVLRDELLMGLEGRMETAGMQDGDDDDDM